MKSNRCILPPTPNYKVDLASACKSPNSSDFLNLQKKVEDLIFVEILPPELKPFVENMQPSAQNFVDLCKMLNFVFQPNDPKNKDFKYLQFAKDTEESGYPFLLHQQTTKPPFYMINWHQFIPYLCENGMVLAPFPVLGTLLSKLADARFINLKEPIPVDMSNLNIQDVCHLLNEFFGIQQGYLS